MNRVIKSDLYRYVGEASVKGFLKAWWIPGFRYSYFLRKAQINKKKSVLGVVFRIIVRYYSFKYGFQIATSSSIKGGFYLGHFGNVVINGDAQIGKNCNISHGVTIGQANRGNRKGTTTIGDCVWIGPNAVLVGKIVVGNNVLIGPGAYVNFDVPMNSVVIGNPGSITARENPVEGYINRIYEEQ